MFLIINPGANRYLPEPFELNEEFEFVSEDTSTLFHSQFITVKRKRNGKTYTLHRSYFAADKPNN